MNRATPPRVLVVDDDADHRLLLSRRLADDGYEVATAVNGLDALENLDGTDLVLLDYKLPGADGLDVLAWIRERYHSGGPSVIMVTGAGSEELVVEAMQAGAIDYVIKDTAYFSRITGVVERAWRHHELSRRADRLQHLVLLVTSAADRDEVFTEIVNGARELLASSNCSLVLRDRGLDVVAQAGLARDVGGITASAARAVEHDAPLREPGRLMVRLPASHGDIVGVLVVHREEALTDEEVRLAETFASFAGLALDRVRRVELERQLVAELQRTIDQRQEFIASVSHELRTPLACILGFTETLTAHWRGLPDRERLDLVERMNRHSVELHALVDQLLEVAARQRGRQPAQVEAVSLDTMVQAVLDDLAPVLTGRDVTVDLTDVGVSADPHLVGRVLTNLISNAAKYSSPGRPITVRSVRDGDGMVRIEITDEGVGIPTEELHRVFEPFWRGTHATSSAARGTGIGLSLVKEYVNAMGGEVDVRSRSGEGSTFAFSLPTVAAATIRG